MAVLLTGRALYTRQYCVLAQYGECKVLHSYSVVSDVQGDVPARLHRSVPMYLGGCSGCRLVP